MCLPPGATQDNPLERRYEAHASTRNRHPKQPAPIDDRSSDDDPEESGSDNDDTVSETSTFGTNMSDFSDDAKDPSSSSNAINV